MASLAVVSTSGFSSGIGHQRRAERMAKAASFRVGIEVSCLNLERDPNIEALISVLESRNESLIIIDVPPALRGDALVQSLMKLKRRGQRIVAVDGPIENVDLLLVPSFSIDPRLLELSHAGLLNLRWGWNYLLIDQRHGVAPRSRGAPLLVLTGGSDVVGLGQRIPQLLDSRLDEEASVTWVVGPEAVDPQLPRTARLSWTVLRDVHDLRPVIEQAAHALTVYGVGALELMHHGVPSVVLSPYGNRDYLELNILEREGLALTSRSETEAVEKTVQMMRNPVLASTIAGRAASRIPQSGTEAALDAVMSLLPEQ